MTNEEQILKKLDGIDAKITTLELSVATNRERVEARFQQGNDKFVALENRIKIVEDSHNTCRGDVEEQYAVKIVRDNIGIIKNVIDWFKERGDLIKAGKKTVMDKIIIFILSSGGTLILAGITYFIFLKK